jgi:hypothetical protein
MRLGGCKGGLLSLVFCAFLIGMRLGALSAKAVKASPHFLTSSPES